MKDLISGKFLGCMNAARVPVLITGMCCPVLLSLPFDPALESLDSTPRSEEEEEAIHVSLSPCVIHSFIRVPCVG